MGRFCSTGEGARQFLGKHKLLNVRCEVVIQKAEPDSTREDAEVFLSIINSTYAKDSLEKVSENVVQLNSGQDKNLLGLINEFEDLFGGILVKWCTEPVDLDLKTVPKQLNVRYFPVTRSNKDTF